jgi:hypothetical protein
VQLSHRHKFSAGKKFDRNYVERKKKRKEATITKLFLVFPVSTDRSDVITLAGSSDCVPFEFLPTTTVFARS